MNITEIMGHLGADPEVRFTPSGQKVISLRLATNSRANGKDETVWWRVTIWEDRCNIEKMLPYLKKGSALIVVGEMKAGIYTDKEGRPQLSLDLTADLVRFSPFGKPDSMRQEGGQAAQSSYGNQEAPKARQTYGEQPFAAQAQNTYASSPQASSSSYGQNNSASMNSMADDDHIPF
jgi:single-strand DNA-binding protein